MKVDLIVQADTVHTLDEARPTAEAVAIADGTIVGVGSRREVTTWRGPSTEVIDLGAATITPGLVDGHIHPVLGIGMTRGVDLSAVTSIPQLIEALRTTPTVEPGGWVLGWGLNPNAFGATPLTYAPLVQARGEAPVFVVMFDAHAALASPAALRAAGIDGPRELRRRRRDRLRRRRSAHRPPAGDPRVRAGAGRDAGGAARRPSRQAAPAAVRDGRRRADRRQRDGLRGRLGSAGHRSRRGDGPAAPPPVRAVLHAGRRRRRARPDRRAATPRRSPLAGGRGEVHDRRHRRRRHRLAARARLLRGVDGTVLARAAGLRRDPEAPRHGRRTDRHPRHRRRRGALRARRARRPAGRARPGCRTGSSTSRRSPPT